MFWNRQRPGAPSENDETPAAQPEAAEAYLQLAQEAQGIEGQEEPRPADGEFSGSPVPGYDGLIGYDDAIARMRERGVGMDGDERFQQFLAMLRERHGIDRVPSYESIVFRADHVRDASIFMMSTAREMDLPTVSMSMETTPQGMPALSFSCSPSFAKAWQKTHGGFEGEGVLMLDAIDEWEVPDLDSDTADSPLQAIMQHGAQQAVNFVRSAVENPEVTVMASCSKDAPVDPFFGELLDPVETFDIELPTRSERGALWRFVAGLHQSLRLQDRDELVRYSEGMSRSDILDAARRAAEEAFAASVRKRCYVGVSRENMLDKLAAYHPLDSAIYAALEEAAVASLRREIAQDELSAD